MRSVSRFKAALVALAMLVAAGSSARAQVLTMVPSDAMVIVKIKNMKDVSDKVAALSQAWGLANIRPELNDPLGTLLTAANLGPGLNKSGEAAVAVMQPGGGAEPNMVVLVPVTDYKAFSGALPNAKPDGELTSFSMGGNPQPGYVADWGQYAAISPQKEMLAKKGAGLQSPAASKKELDSKDLIIYANMKVIRGIALPVIQQNRQQALQGIERAMANGGGANPKYAPLIKAYIGQFITVAEGFLRDADAATFGINLSKDGISTTLMADFQPGSYSGKAVSAMKNTQASYTAGLPNGKYFIYGGMTIHPEVDVQLLNDFVAPIEKEITAMGAEGKPLLDYLNSFRTYLSATRQQNFGMVAPPANAIGQQGFVQVVNVITGDTAKIQSAQRQMMESAGAVMKVSGAGNLLQVTTKRSAKVVDGVELDEMMTKMTGQPQTPQEQQAAFMIQMLYGPNGLTGYTGLVAKDRLLAVAGIDDAMLTASVQSAKANSDALAQGPAAKVTPSLPSNRLAVLYVPIDTITTTVLDVMAARGMPGGVKLPPNLPPLAGAIDTDGAAIRLDGYIPAQTVQSLIAAGMQVWLQGMNGGGAGQPGGL